MKNKTDRTGGRNYSRVGLLIAIIIAICLGVGIYFLVRYIKNYFSNDNKGNEEPEINEVTGYNRLLKLINDDVQKVEGSRDVSSLISFDYSGNTFYISGINNDESAIYSYQLDLSSHDLENAYTATKYLIDNDINEDVNLTKYNVIESASFNDKYVTSTSKGPHYVGNVETTNKVFATLLDSGTIKAFNNVNLNQSLSDGYKPSLIDNSNPLYKMYFYIANK